MYFVQLDKETGTRIGLYLVKNVQNIKNLRKKILSSELNCCAVKPSLVIDPLQIVVAANKAVLNKRQGKLITKSLNSELLYNLSASKNITQSLTKFGIGESDENVLLVVFDEKGEDDSFDELKSQVQGVECRIEEIRDLYDIDAIKKTYKITEEELQVSTLANSVISRIATKEFGSN